MFLRWKMRRALWSSECSGYKGAVAMEQPGSIAAMVAKAVKDGIPSPQPKRRRGRGAPEAAMQARKIAVGGEDDSDFDDNFISDALWNKMHKHEENDFDQHIFNVFRQDKIDTQERKVNVTTAVCVRDCPGKAEEIAKWTKQAKPVLSKAPKRKQAKKRLKTAKM